MFLYGIYNFISDSMLYLYLQCTLRYGLDSTIVCSKITWKMKEEKESEENWGNQAFRPIMERLLGRCLECSEGTSSIAQ